MKKQQGFTLIELMIVVAIVAILAAIAVPAYQDFTIRAQVSEGASLAAGAKTSMEEFYADRNAWPANNDEAGVTEDVNTKYVETVTVAGETITVKFGNDASPRLTGELIYTANPIDGADGLAAIDWDCVASTIPAKYLPANCRAGGASSR